MNADPSYCPQCGTTVSAEALAGLCPRCLMQAAIESHRQTEPEQQRLQSTFSPPSIEELADHFNELEILELIGRGGMGAVYKARQRNLDRLVAVKILPPEVGAEAGFAERFEREARVLARLNHANVIHVYDSGKVGEYYYFVMEFVEGVSLRAAIQAKTLDSKDAIAMVTQICDALQYAHEQGVVHRDIKPENILISDRGQVKIADFGLAKLTGTAPTVRLTGTYQAMGTPNYVAPEQLERPQEVDHRADIYSLGVVFYEMLTGELPLGRFLPPSKKVEIDVRLDEVVLRSLEKEPELRYQHASDVKTGVEHVTDSGSVAIDEAAAVDDVSSNQRSNAPNKAREGWRDLRTGMAMLDEHAEEIEGGIYRFFDSRTASILKVGFGVAWQLLLWFIGFLILRSLFRDGRLLTNLLGGAAAGALIVWSLTGLLISWWDIRALLSDTSELRGRTLRLARYATMMAGGLLMWVCNLSVSYPAQPLLFWFVGGLSMALLWGGGVGTVEVLDRQRRYQGMPAMWDDREWTTLDTGLTCFAAIGLLTLIANPLIPGIEVYIRINLVVIGLIFWLGHLFALVARMGRRKNLRAAPAEVV